MSESHLPMVESGPCIHQQTEHNAAGWWGNLSEMTDISDVLSPTYLVLAR
jgi:hypothetical protein